MGAVVLYKLWLTEAIEEIKYLQIWGMMANCLIIPFGQRIIGNVTVPLA